MAKSRKRKNANKDFQKVKLKVGKRLKKADNVTNASFHTRTIQVTQKIKNVTTNEPQSKRKLNLNELLNHFQHYSTSTRHDGVTGLRELLSSYPEIIVPNLLSIVEKTTPLFVDKDPVVRQAVLKLLQIVFQNVSEKHVVPFLHMISAHLCCAMTHLYEDIQADSLQILDLMLEHFPALVVSNSSEILQNFIEQISHVKLDTKTGSHYVKPKLKMTSCKWRAKVLARLHKLLSAILGLYHKTEKQSEKMGLEKITGIWKMSENLHIQPFSNHTLVRWKRPEFTLRTKVNQTKGLSLCDESDVRKFVKLLIPLLLECWIEANTITHSDKGTGSLVTTDSLPLLCSVIKVIQQLFQYVLQTFPAQKSWMKQTYLTDFRNQLLKSFPYSVHIPAKAQSKMDNKTVQESVTNMNLGICDIMTHLLTTDTDKKWEITLLQYLEDIVDQNDLDKQQMKIVIEILKRFVEEDEILCLDKIMGVLIQRYKASHPLSAHKRLLLAFFSDIIFDRYQQTKIGADIIDTFLTSLPDLFLNVSNDNQIAAHVLKVIKQAVCQNCWILLQQLNKFVCQTIGSKENFFINLSSDMQKQLVELVYYVPNLSENTMKSLLNLLLDVECPIQSSLYLIQTIHLRYSVGDKSVQRLSEYISFMMSLILRYTDFDLDVQTGQDIAFSKTYLDKKLKLERSFVITEAVCNLVRQYTDTEQIVQIITHFLERQKYTECQVVSILTLANHMEFYKYRITDNLKSQLVCNFWRLCCKMSSIHEFLSNTQKEECGFLCLTEKLTGFVMKFRNSLSTLVSLLNQGLLDNNKNLTEIKKTCQTGILWLQYMDRLLQKTERPSPLISISIKRIQESCPDLKGLQWWSDFAFMISRLKL